MSPPWWAAFPPAEATIACGVGQHTLRWEQGQLIPADHPDPEGEMVLAALGGGKAECVGMAEAWGRHTDDLDVLALGPRSPADKLTVTWDHLDELRSLPRPMPFRRLVGQGGIHHAAAGPPRRARPLPTLGDDEMERARARLEELLSLFALGSEFQWRLSGAVAWAWSPDGSRARDRAKARPALVAALTGRLAPGAGAWLGMDPGQVSATLHEGPGWGSIHRTGLNASLHASLPAGWLAQVWAPGLTMVGDHLVVDVLDVSWPRARVLALPRPGTEPVVLSIHRDGEHWNVARRGGS